MQDKLLERLYDEEDKRTKETEALKNGLDEEKMLRGQEQDRVRKVLADTVESLGNEVASQVEAMNKLVDEEKEERAMQHDDMINRLDRERKDRERRDWERGGQGVGRAERGRTSCWPSTS